MARQDDATQEVARPKRHRRWPWVLVGLILLIGVLVALAPVYLSSDSFKRMIQAKISHATGGTADIGNLSVGWWKGVQVSNFSFRNENGWAAVSINALDTQPRLASLLAGTFSLGRTVINSPQIDIDLRKRPAPKPSQGKAAAHPVRHRPPPWRCSATCRSRMGPSMSRTRPGRPFGLPSSTPSSTSVSPDRPPAFRRTWW